MMHFVLGSVLLAMLYRRACFPISERRWYDYVGVGVTTAVVAAVIGWAFL